MVRRRKKGGGARQKVALNLSKILHQYIRGKKYIPSTFSDLVRDLNIADSNREVLKEVLDRLVDEGELAFQREKYVLPETPEPVLGTIQVHAKGFGFVKNKDGPDVFIPRHATKGAVDGDTVEISLSPHPSTKGPEGEVISVLKRSKTHLACTVLEVFTDQIVAYAPLLGMDRPVQVLSETTLRRGDRIVCRVLDWKKKDMVKAEFTRLLGNIADPSIDVEAAIEEFDLVHEFSQESIQEAKQFTKDEPKEELLKGERKDFTSWEIVTIDPDTAKDYDDAISLTEDERGHFLLGVHIADVSHYVKEDSFLDREAYRRCNSTYFPGKCVPMLPEELSNELCSLKPKVVRLTQSVLIEFNEKGDLVRYEIQRGAIQSQKRFTYKEALQILEGEKKSKHAPLLKRMKKLCLLLKEKRRERGSIDFSLSEHVILVDEKGVPQKIEKVDYDITHQMIEEFALIANEMTAKHLFKKEKTLIYRVHEDPSEDNFEDFLQFARTLGFQLPAQPTKKQLQKLFEEAKKTPFLAQLSISFIRSMKLAAYSSENLGHYGLALEYYCHFTSPIRRYTDLIIQRLLFNEVKKEIDIDAIALACSEKERISFKAESSVNLLKRLRFANRQFEEDPERVYSAIITKIKPFSLFLHVPDFDLEATLHISELGSDYFEYHPLKMCFRGKRTGKTFRLGQEVFVCLRKIDYILLKAEWKLRR